MGESAGAWAGSCPAGARALPSSRRAAPALRRRQHPQQQLQEPPRPGAPRTSVGPLAVEHDLGLPLALLAADAAELAALVHGLDAQRALQLLARQARQAHLQVPHLLAVVAQREVGLRRVAVQRDGHPAGGGGGGGGAVSPGACCRLAAHRASCTPAPCCLQAPRAMHAAAQAHAQAQAPPARACAAPVVHARRLLLGAVVAQVRHLAVVQDARLPLVLAVAAAHAKVLGGAPPAGQPPPGHLRAGAGAGVRARVSARAPPAAPRTSTAAAASSCCGAQQLLQRPAAAAAPSSCCSAQQLLQRPAAAAAPSSSFTAQQRQQLLLHCPAAASPAQRAQQRPAQRAPWLARS